MDVIHTERLVLRWLSRDDADFIRELVNDSDWLRYIGDRGVRTRADARDYLAAGPLAMYARLGFGLYMVELREARVPIGICGLLKRDALEEVDVGFALLPQHRGRGYAYEAAAATLEYGASALGLPRIVAIVSPENDASIHLLGRLGLRFERTVRLSNEASEVWLFGPAPATPPGPDPPGATSPACVAVGVPHHDARHLPAP